LNSPDSPRTSAVVWSVGAALWLAVGVLLFARTVDRGLNHDEHQFIVPGALLARDGLLPYRDYPLFHLPNLVFAYAALDRLTGDPILGPRLLSFAASWLAAGVILLASLRGRRDGALSRLAIGAALMTLLVFDPLFIYTAGKTWNHEVPTALFLVAILFQLEAARRNSLMLVALSGAACGLAVGCRLTFAPCLLPLVVVTLAFPVQWPRRWAMAGVFTIAATVSLAPSLYFLATVPKPFLFGNLEFPRLGLLDPANSRIHKTMTLWRKLRYFGKDIVLPSWPIFLAFVAATGIALRRKALNPSYFSVRIVVLAAAFVLLGCFLPSRYQYQHFFALIPLLLFGIALAIDSIEHTATRRLAAPSALIILSITSLASATFSHRGREQGAIPHWQMLAHRDEWFPSRAAAIGAEIRQHVPAGPVLTLAPAWPLVGGLRVYPEFATGPFAWRSARFVAPDRRPRLHIVAPDDLESFLAANPPGAILTGVEDDDLEAPMIDYAHNHGFREVTLSRKRTLWLPR